MSLVSVAAVQTSERGICLYTW